MKLARSIVLLAALAAVSGCDSLGDGSTVVSIQVRDANGQPITGLYPMSQCLRDQLVAIATFSDGTNADFSFRVTWSSSDASVVQVSNGDIAQTVIDDGAFVEQSAFVYRPGTLVPKAAAGSGTVTITASFLGLTDSADVQITQPEFRARPLVDNDPMPAPATAYLGPGTFQRFAFLVEQADGRVVVPTAANLVGSLNPILWTFAEASEFDPADSTVTGDFDKYAVPSAGSPTATITPATGIVRGVAAEASTYTVKAVTSLCPADPAFVATAPVQVAPFTTTNPLVLEHEADINGDGVSPTGDLFAGTGELLKIIGNLDTNGDLATAEQTQDLSAQADVRTTHHTVCAATDANCTCDTDGTNCTKRLLAASGNFIFSNVNNDSAETTVQACFANDNTSHFDDCEAAAGVALESNTLDIHVIPVNLTSTGGSFSIVPASPAAERAFTYPGRQFDAYGTFTALAGTPFNGGASDTATQKLTRSVAWFTREQGSTTTAPTMGFVRNSDDGFFAPIGSFSYVADVAANTTVDIRIGTVTPFAAIEPPSIAVPFTICPSTAGTCP